MLPTSPTSSPGITVSPFWAIRLLMWPYQEIEPSQYLISTLLPKLES